MIYFQLIAATVIGFLVFGDWPAPLALLGLAVILASGLGGLALAPRRQTPVGSTTGHVGGTNSP